MKIQEIKKKIIEELEGKKIVYWRTSLKSRLELFVLGWKHTRKFPDYSFWKELKRLFTIKKMEVTIK